MIDAMSLRRALVLTTALAACAAPTASGRVADAPVGGVVSAQPAAGHAPDQGVPPRVDGIGVRPSSRAAVAAVAIVLSSPRHGSDAWSAAIAVAALLSLALLGLAGRSALIAARAPSRRA
jgi:hypothetical protein